MMSCKVYIKRRQLHEWLATPKGRKTINGYLGPADLSICKVFLFKYQHRYTLTWQNFHTYREKKGGDSRYLLRHKKLWVIVI